MNIIGLAEGAKVRDGVFIEQSCGVARYQIFNVVSYLGGLAHSGFELMVNDSESHLPKKGLDVVQNHPPCRSQYQAPPAVQWWVHM